MDIGNNLWIAIPILIICSIFYSSHLQKKRYEALKSFFSRLGYQFDQTSNGLITSQIAHLNLLQRGRRQNLSNVARITIGKNELIYCDFKYTTGHGKRAKTQRLSLLCIVGQFDLPEFTLEPEGLFSKIAQSVGYHDIDLELDPDFSKMFVLRGVDTQRIKSLFSHDLTHSLKRQPKAKVEGSKGALVYCSTTQIKPVDMRQWIEETKRVLQSFPV